MKVLLSIKPEFVEKIFSGEKKYEFRRIIFKRKDINKVIIYATAPVSRVVGEFEIETILFSDIHTLWEETRTHAGIDQELFFHYFTKKEKGYAIKIKAYKEYNKPRSLKEAYGLFPPQSFIYIE